MSSFLWPTLSSSSYASLNKQYVPLIRNSLAIFDLSVFRRLVTSEEQRNEKTATIFLRHKKEKKQFTE